MRKEYELTERQFNLIMEASKPIPMVAIQAGLPMSQQERANRVWSVIAREVGCDMWTVKPIPEKGERWFSAEVLDDGETKGESTEGQGSS